MPEMHETVGAFCTYEEAYLARNALSEEGIEAFVIDEHLTTLDFRLKPALGGVKLLASRQDAERATSILNEIFRQAGRHEKIVVTDEKRALLAFQSAGFSLLFQIVGFPFFIYSTWIVIGLLRSGNPLSPVARKRLIWAGLIDSFFLCATAFLVYLFIMEP